MKREEGKITTLTSYLDLLSKPAFLQDLVRSMFPSSSISILPFLFYLFYSSFLFFLFFLITASAWQEPFEYWMPLVINEHHGRRALPYIKSAIGTA